MPDLIVTPYTPTLRSGRALRTYGIARALEDVEILYTCFGARRPAAEFGPIPARSVESSRGAARALLYASARIRGVPSGFARAWSPELRAAALESSADRLIADGPAAASMLLGHAPMVYVAHNIESQLERPGARAMRRFERRLLQGAQESWLVSRRDVRLARELAPDANLRLVPNVIDVEAIEPAAGGTAALLVADYAYEPNAHALRFMLDEVMPRAWELLPRARLRLVGRSLPSMTALDERIEAVGEVANLRDAYAGAACAVVPLLSGSGSPLKFVEALAYGVPVVATGHAAAGLEVVPGEHYLRADAAADFAAALVKVLDQGAPELARRGRRLALERYSIEALKRALAA